ncbi:glycoside hydrolase family 78 protein, partial [Aureobasidium sp. EXF-3399]
MSATMRVLNCGIHGFHETLGLDVDEVRVFWTLEADKYAVQAAYRVVVSTSEEDVAAEPASNIDFAFDTGRISTDEQRNILLWDGDGVATHSEVQTFFTAYPRSQLLPPYSMNQKYMPHSSLIFRTWFEDIENKWKAVWIGDGGDKPLYIRKGFNLARKPFKAIALASGLGHFDLHVNGEPASDHVIDPGWSNYHRTVQYVGYDLTTHLDAGKNVLAAHLGNGFYAGSGTEEDRFFWPMYEDNTYVRYGNELCFFAELHLFYEDGTHDIIHTDPSWKVRKSATTLANIYASETHDKRLLPCGWTSPGFNEADWSPAKPLTGPRGLLRYQSQPPVVLHDKLEPVSTTSPRPGVVCFDLGQNASIMLHLSVEGPAGSKIMIRYSETANADGTVLMPDPLFKDFETKVFSKIYLAGTGAPEDWRPDFSFTAARYIQIEGVATEEGNGLPVVRSLFGRHISSASQRVGSMKTDKDDVNALIKASHWSLSSNIYSYHTDCPQIEKFGWLEVTHLLAPASQYVFDMEALYTKIIYDMIDAQEPSGLVPTMAPEIRYMCGPLHDTISWGGALCLLPELLFKYYGSTWVIPQVYPAAVRYMDYIKTKERLGGLIEHGLGDWGRDIAWGNLQANIETAYYYKCLQNTAMMARHLGLSEETAKYESWAARVLGVYNKELLITDDESSPYAYYTSRDNIGQRDCQAVAQAYALQFDMVPTEHISSVQNAFLASVSDNRIRSGELGLKCIFETLIDLQRPDIVLAMARQEEHPSYMRFLRQGETTFLEFWQDECRSKSHDLFCTIHEWFYAGVLGIKPKGNAYKTFSIEPPYGSEFKNVEGHVDCPYGRIEVKFSQTAEKVALGVTVPVGTRASVRIPHSSSTSIKLSRSGETMTPEKDGQYVVLRNGSYSIEFE